MAVDVELEAVLRPIQYPMPPYPPKVITLANGKKMVVRQGGVPIPRGIVKSINFIAFSLKGF